MHHRVLIRGHSRRRLIIFDAHRNLQVRIEPLDNT